MAKYSLWLILLLFFVSLELHDPLKTTLVPKPGPDIQILLPRRLAPHQSHKLELTLLHTEPNKPFQCNPQLKGSSENVTCTVHNHQRATLTLPPLPTGQYQLELAGNYAGRPFSLAPSSLDIRSQPSVFLTAHQDYYFPGSTLHFSAHIPPPFNPVPQNLFFQVKREGTMLLRRRAQLNPWGYTHLSLAVPEDWAPGNYTLQLLADQRPLATRRFQLRAEAPPLLKQEQHFQVRFQQQQLIQQVSQDIPVTVQYGDGRAIPQGWLRLQNQTFPIKNGQVQVQVKPPPQSQSLSYTLGNDQGELHQGQFHYTLLPKGLIAYPVLRPDSPPSPNPPLEWRIVAEQAGPIHYLLGQAFQSFSRGQTELKPGENSLKLAWPATANRNQPLWLIITHPETQQSYHYSWHMPPLSALPEGFHLSPSHPDALDPLSLNQTLPTPKLFSEVRQAVPIALPPLPQYLPASTRFLSVQTHPLFPKPVNPLPLWAGAYGLWALGLPSLLIPGLLRKLKAAQSPLSLAIPRLLTGIVLGSLSTLVLALLATALSPRLYQPLSLGFAGLFSLLFVCLFWQFKSLKALRFPLVILWLAQLIVLWAFNAYQPRLLPGYWLWVALCWWLLLWRTHRLRGGKLTQWHSLLLSSLCILAIATPSSGFMPHISPSETSPFTHHHIRLLNQDVAHITYSFQSQTGIPASIPPLYQSGARRLDIRLFEPQGKMQTIRTTLLNQPTVIPTLGAPRFAIQGDKLHFPLYFHNESSKAQSLTYSLGRTQPKPLTLKAQETQLLEWPLTMQRAGQQKLSLYQRLNGKLTQRDTPIYIKAQDKAQAQDKLQLVLDIPKHAQLELGEELPVIVHFQHGFQQAQALGLQIGIPSGYQVLTPNLADVHNRKWLASHHQKPGYLNLLTKPIAPQTEITFHFRLKVGMKGQLHMPASSLFALKAPNQRLVRVEDKVFSTR